MATGRRRTGAAGTALPRAVAAAFAISGSWAPIPEGTVSGRRKGPTPPATGAAGASPTVSGAPGLAAQVATRLALASGTTTDARQRITGKMSFLKFG